MPPTDATSVFISCHSLPGYKPTSLFETVTTSHSTSRHQLALTFQSNAPVHYYVLKRVWLPTRPPAPVLLVRTKASLWLQRGRWAVRSPHSCLLPQTGSCMLILKANCTCPLSCQPLKFPKHTCPLYCFTPPHSLCCEGTLWGPS